MDLCKHTQNRDKIVSTFYFQEREIQKTYYKYVHPLFEELTKFIRWIEEAVFHSLPYHKKLNANKQVCDHKKGRQEESEK